MSKTECINGWTKNTMIDHIKANFKGKSITTSGCKYHLEDKKCAAGLFIKDEYYSEALEGKNISSIMEKNASIGYSMPLAANYMDGFQSCHDESNSDRTLTDMLKWIEENVK